MLTLSGAGQPQNGGAGIEERFVISVQTDNAGTSADNEFTIPWVGTYDIDWGDGNTDAGVVDTQIHTYASAGTYDVAVTATTGRIYFNNGGDKAKLLDIKNWGSCAWTSMERAFEGCSMMDITATDIPDFSNLTSLGAMFKRCINLIFNDSINFWNLGNVNKLTLGYHLGIFSGALKFNQPINNWDVSNVTNMSSLFGDDIGPNVFNQPLNNWDVSNVSNMDLMFRKCSNFNQPLDNWDVSNVTIMRGMFNSCADFNQNIGMWDVSNVNRFADGFMGMFSFATSFNNGGSPSINNWDVSKATAFGGRYSSNSGLFSGASSFNQPLGQWDVTNVTDMRHTFRNATSFDQDISNWNIINVGNFMYFMTGISLSNNNYDELLIGWETTLQAAYPNGAGYPHDINITFGNSQYTYKAAAARQTLIDTYGWTITDGGQVAAPEFAISVKTDNAGTSADNQFTLPWIGTYDVDWGDGVVETGVVDTQTHTYDSAGTYDIKVTAATGSIFFNAPRFTDYKLLQIKNWGDCEWTSLESAFSGCANLDFDSSNIDAPNLRNCTSLYKTFNFCTLLGNLNGNNVDLSSWDVSNVTNIGEFFITYNTRVNVNLSGWVINPNITFGRLLDRCNILDVTDWDVSNVTNFSNIFHSATRLNEIAGLNTWDISNGVDFTSIFRRVYDLTSLGDLSSWSFAPNSNLTNMFFASIRENMDQNTKNSILNLDVSNATNMRNMFNYSNITSWLNLSNWDVSGVSDFNGFLSNSTLTTQNYDETLISWATQSLQNNINISFGNSQYTLGGSAEAARNTLINTYGWTITDGGGIFVGLLDTYTGAAAAYSLRDLASASVGSAVVRVRRSSDNTEQDFTAAEITDGTLTTFTGANDGFVTTWYDQSGNSVNAVQATATLQPKLVTSGVVRQVNNKPALTLFSNNVGFSTNTSYAGSNFSIVSVYDKTLSSGADTIFLDNNLNSPDGIFSYRNGSKQGVYRSGDKTIEGNLKDGQAIAFTLLSNNVISYYNNTDLVGSSTDANAAANVDFNSFRIGRSNPFEIQEVILYPTNQTPNVQGFNDNMNNYYSVYEIPVSGLLFDYPDPLVAYSLRQLTTFESGNKVNVVRVRRSNDNVEKDFIDTEITDGTLTTFTGANDGFVVKWYDQSGDLNDAIQTSAVNQPKLVDNGTVILDNGKPAIKYDSTGFDTLTTLNNVTGINSIFYVLNAETSTGGPTQSLLGDNFGALDYVSGQSGNIILWTGVPNDIKNGSNYIDSQPYNFLATDRPLVQSLITMIHNSPIGAFNQISEDRSIGRSWEGKLQELVVYSSDQSANRTGIEANINTEYTIY